MTPRDEYVTFTIISGGPVLLLLICQQLITLLFKLASFFFQLN